ncbi:MAG: type I-C CRISPR-associated protein Cas8c/Csd1 [Bacteroidota bacterium]
MAWIQKLYETYDNCQSMVGIVTDDNEVPLLPICHSTQKAHIEIVLDQRGNFKRARVVPKDEATTIIPCTENSGGRTSGPEPHPLCDKLQYVAKDYTGHGGRKSHRFNLYSEKLENWCRSDYSHPKVDAVLKYVKRGKVIQDLIVHKILLTSKKGKLSAKSDHKKEKEILTIFDVLDSQDEAFVRWVVEIPGERESKVWKDKTLWEQWIRYYSNTKEGKTLCYVTGKEEFEADQHPKYIRRPGDGAKLISSNDADGFTYRGRFTDKYGEQAAGVGFEVTQKAHSALRWLISRQGYRRDEQAIVAWATSGKDIPPPLADPLAILGVNEMPSDESPSSYTAESIGIRFKKRIAGYGPELGKTTGVVVMGLDSVTPGRMAITFYRELTGSEYLERINRWHETCAWIHWYRFVDIQENGKAKRKPLPFVGAPAPSDIAEAAYGNRVDNKLRKATVERILPCIIDGQQIPRDLVESAVRRASNRVALDDWQWEKTLSIACALFKKLKEKENYSMALDPNRKTRDYLYGRLLALADSLEGWALNKAREDRETNAARLMQRFSERPYNTWRTIELALAPYKARLGGKSKKRQRMIDQVVDAFDANDFMNDKRLSGEFLLGYHTQREFLRNNREQIDDSDSDNNETTNNTTNQ